MGIESLGQKATFYTKDESGEYRKIGTAENIKLYTDADVQIQSVKEIKTDRGYKVYQYIVKNE